MSRVAEASRGAAPGDWTAAHGDPLTPCGIECLEEQLRRLRAGDAVAPLDHGGRHGRRGEHPRPRRVGQHVGGVRI